MASWPLPSFFSIVDAAPARMPRARTTSLCSDITMVRALPSWQTTKTWLNFRFRKISKAPQPCPPTRSHAQCQSHRMDTTDSARFYFYHIFRFFPAHGQVRDHCQPSAIHRRNVVSKCLFPSERTSRIRGQLCRRRRTQSSSRVVQDKRVVY